MAVLNAFQAVRPRGVDLPSAVPVERKPGREPLHLPGSMPRVLDRKGCLNAPLAPRVYGSISIENREQGRASYEKRRALMQGGV